MTEKFLIKLNFLYANFWTFSLLEHNLPTYETLTSPFTVMLKLKIDDPCVSPL